MPERLRRPNRKCKNGHYQRVKSFHRLADTVGKHKDDQAEPLSGSLTADDQY